MKLVVIGFGQCGGRLADEFVRLGRRAHAQRSIEIITDAFALNSDTADLRCLHNIKSDSHHRILIGVEKTRGHGAAKLCELGAEIAKDDGDKVIDAINSARRFFEVDALLLIASTGGGTGSGAMPIMAQQMKERYTDKSIYCMSVLPFEYEQETEERTIYNTALCLKSRYPAANAVFLVDNQRYSGTDLSLRTNFAKINEQIVEPFYNLLCAGEERKAKHVGSKVLDTGDIKQTVSGWTALGYGKALLPLFKLPFERTHNFMKKSTEIHRGKRAMDEAISDLSIKCDIKDAARALYLLSAPAEEMHIDVIRELDAYLRSLASNAIIRNGDYPDERGVMDVVVIVSELSYVDNISKYYTRSAALAEKIQAKPETRDRRVSDMEDISKDLPSLL